MNKSDRLKIRKSALSILKIYGETKESCINHLMNDFQTSSALQGYRDSLESLKRYGLILDYNLRDLTITEINSHNIIHVLNL